MRFKLLACDVLTREVCYCVARSPHVIDPQFTPKGEHNVPERLRDRLQGQIDALADDETRYDAVLLGYGLCGNSVVGLRAGYSPEAAVSGVSHRAVCSGGVLLKIPRWAGYKTNPPRRQNSRKCPWPRRGPCARSGARNLPDPVAG